MRKHCLCLSFILISAASQLSAETNPLKVCVWQDDEGYDAFRLARQLASRKLDSGASLALVVITGKVLGIKEEQRLADPATPFARVVQKEQTAKARSAEVERLGCDYAIMVWYHEGAGRFDQTSVGYKLRKAGSKKVLAGASAPPFTVFVRQGRWVFDPYLLFANQIVKKLNSLP